MAETRIVRIERMEVTLKLTRLARPLKTYKEDLEIRLGYNVKKKEFFVRTFGIGEMPLDVVLKFLNELRDKLPKVVETLKKELAWKLYFNRLES